MKTRFVWLIMHRVLGIQRAILCEKRAKEVLEIRNEAHFKLFKERPYTLVRQELS